MAKSLNSYRYYEKGRERAITRRLENPAGGLGFWAAIDARGISLSTAHHVLKNKKVKMGLRWLN